MYYISRKYKHSGEISFDSFSICGRSLNYKRCPSIAWMPELGSLAGVVRDSEECIFNRSVGNNQDRISSAFMSTTLYL